MNQAQQKTLDRIHEAVAARGNIEVKELRVNECRTFIAISIDVGLIGEQGLQSVFCRTHSHLMIGTRGGLKARSEVATGAGNKWKPTSIGEAIRQLTIV